MSIFGQSSRTKFGFGTDQGIDSTVERATLSGAGGKLGLSLFLNDGGKVTAELPLSSLQFTQSFDFNNQVVTGVGNPVNPADAANKLYVDSAIAGLTIKAPVRVATTVNVSLGSVSVIDGVTLALNDRVLVKDQTDARENGIYSLTGTGLVRSSDADNLNPNNELRGGVFVFVEGGTTNQGTGWVITSPSGVITIGTDNIVFQQFSAFLYSAGTGLTMNNRVLSVVYGTAAGTSCQGNDGRLSNNLRASNNLSDLTNVATARSNLGLGSLAPLDTTQVLQVANNLSDLGNVVTARSNLGLGTLATMNSTQVLQVANNLSDLGNAGTARSNLGLGTMATQAVPSAGYLKSNGTSISSVATVTSADITGLGTMASQNSNNVNITGGAIYALSQLDVFSTNNYMSHLYTSFTAAGTGCINVAILGTGINAGERAAVLLGQSINTGDSSMLNFRYQGDNSASNAMEFGFFGNEGLMKVYNNGKVGIGTGSTAPAQSKLTVIDSTSMQVNISNTENTGMFLHSTAASQALVSGGGSYDGSSWIARAAQASQIDMTGGAMRFCNNMNLTVGSSYIPTAQLNLTPTDFIASVKTSLVCPNQQLRFNVSSNDVGGYLLSFSDSHAVLSAGTSWTGSYWLAKTNVGSSFIELYNATYGLYIKRNTTAGVPFDREQVCLFENYQWYFCDKYNTLDMYSPFFGSKKPADAQQPGQWCIFKEPNFNRITLQYNDNGTLRSYVLLAW